jgi:hypothetical protein
MNIYRQITLPAWFLLIILVLNCISAVSAAIFFIRTYGDIQYNLTDQQKQETAILPLCYTNNTLGIEGLNKTCASIYGGPVD